MAAVFYFPLPGTPTAPGNQLSFFEAGLDVPLDVWTDPDLTIPWSQPVIFNAAGNSDGPIYVSSSPDMKVVYEDADGVAIPGYPVDFVTPSTIPGVMTTSITTLTNAQIKALPTTPITLVTAPASGVRVKVFSVSLVPDFTAGAYTNANTASATLQVQTAAGTWLALGPVNDSSLTTPLARLTTFLGADTLIADLLPYAEAIQSGGGAGDWGFLQPAVTASASDYDANAVQIAMDNNGSGALTGGNAANSLTVTVYFALETV